MHLQSSSLVNTKNANMQIEIADVKYCYKKLVYVKCMREVRNFLVYLNCNNEVRNWKHIEQGE